MKQELKELKKLATNFIEAKNNFEKQRDIFNLMYVYSDFNDEQVIESPYDFAKTFYEKYGFVVECSTALRNEHPRYGEKRFKNALIENIIINQELDYEVDYDFVNYLVDSHIAYESLGYFEVKDLEDEMNKLYEQIDKTTKNIKDKSCAAAKGVGRAVVKVMKPYGEVAKGQLNAVEGKAKDVVNKGTKKLIKVLENVADKTSDKK